MSIVRHAAARGEFLDIPLFLHGVTVALDGEDGLKMELSHSMYEEIHRFPNPEDLTEMVEQYYHDWWSQWSNWWNETQVMVDYWAAFKFHGKKVSFHLLDDDSLLIGPDLQFGKIRGPYLTIPNPGKAAPKETLIPHPCKSRVCQDRLYLVLEEVKKTNAIAHSWQAHVETDQVTATHDIFPLKVLKKYMLNNKKSSFTVTDVNNLLYEAGDEGTVKSMVFAMRRKAQAHADLGRT